MGKQLVVLVAFLALSAPAIAQDTPWSLAFNVGADVAVTGDLHGGGTGSVLGLPTTVESRSYGDVYGTPFTWSVDFGYMPTTNGEIRARLFRTRVESERLQVGDVATLGLFAKFQPYAALGADFGYRQYFDVAPTFQPFVGGAVGFLHADETNGTFSVPLASVVLSDVPMYSASTVPTAALSAGVMVPLGPNFGVQGGVDFRWHGSLEPIDGLAGTGLEPINDETSRWSMPLTIGAVVRF